VFPNGRIVLARFPFTDLSGDKRRPVLVVSRDNDALAGIAARTVATRAPTARAVACRVASLPNRTTEGTLRPVPGLAGSVAMSEPARGIGVMKHTTRSGRRRS
jgi:hypothetical protein